MEKCKEIPLFMSFSLFYLEVSQKVFIFAASILMLCVTDGWADILEEALAFCSCLP